MAYFSPQTSGVQGGIRRKAYDPRTFSLQNQFSTLVAAKKEEKQRKLEQERFDEEMRQEVAGLEFEKEKAKKEAKTAAIGSIGQGIAAQGSSNKFGRLAGLGQIGLGTYGLLGGGSKGLTGGLAASALMSKGGRSLIDKGFQAVAGSSLGTAVKKIPGVGSLGGIASAIGDLI